MLKHVAPLTNNPVFPQVKVLKWDDPAPAGNRPGIGQAEKEPDVSDSSASHRRDA